MISTDPSYGTQFSICTLVTNKETYSKMVDSYHDAGFGNCEFLTIDNTEGNKVCAYRGLNLLMNQAQGKYISHQDVLIKDHISILDKKLDELEKLDPTWAIVGNAGGISPGKFSLYLEAQNNNFINIGTFPSKVQSLDENWMLLKASAKLSFSNELSGFHLYGTDICLNAKILGYNSYVIQYLLKHEGKGIQDPSFIECKSAITKKYNKIFNDTIIQTTCCQIHLKNGEKYAN